MKNLLLSNVTIFAAKKLDIAPLKTLIQGYTDPLTTLLMWLAPLAAIIAILSTGIRWFFSDEDMRERNKPFPRIKKIIFVLIIVESLDILFKALGF